jgi:hypothetical protein
VLPAVDTRRKLLQLRRKLPVAADILPSDGHGNLKPYLAQRKRSTCFEKLDRTGKTGRGTDVTQMISDDREDRIIPAPELIVKRRQKLRNRPPPKLAEAKTQPEASAKQKRDDGRRRKK